MMKWIELGAESIRRAWLGLYRAKQYALVAVMTLAVGISAVSTVFALVEGVLLRPMPVREESRLVVAWRQLRAGGMRHYPFRVRDIDAISKGSKLIESVAGVDYNGAVRLVVSEGGTSNYITAAAVTGGFFGVLGVEPLLGRLLGPADDVPGAEYAMVLAHASWQRRYAGAHDVIGRRVTVNERRFVIVGVLPPDIQYPRDSEAWVSTAIRAAMIGREPSSLDVDLLARLRPEATSASVTAELSVLMARLEADATRGTATDLTPVVHDFRGLIVGEARTTILVLFGAVAVVLLIACVNLANLFLLRSDARQHEWSVQAVLGASRRRLASELFIECLLIAVAAGGCALALTWVAVDGLLSLAPAGVPRPEAVRVDGAVFVFAMTASCIAAALAACLPVMSSRRVALSVQLRSDTAGAIGTASSLWRRALVSGQVALSVLVIAAAGLLGRSLIQLQTVEMGLAEGELVFMSFSLPEGRYAERDARLLLLRQLVPRLEAVPGVRGATPVNVRPFAGTAGWDAPRFTAEGQGAEQAAANAPLNLESIHPNYFSTLGVTLVRGRAFTEFDASGAVNVAALSRDVAERMWPGQDPIGKRLKLGGVASSDGWRTVVAVVEPTRYRELADPRPTLYLPAAQFNFGAEMLVLRLSTTANPGADVLQTAVRSVDPAIAVVQVSPFSEMLARPLAGPRFGAVLAGLFAGVAMLLAAIGTFAIVSTGFRRRHREIGLRLALGATGADVRRLLLLEAGATVSVGVMSGLLFAAIAARQLETMLFDTNPLDPLSFLLAAMLAAGVSVLATLPSVWRASHVDPRRLLQSN